MTVQQTDPTTEFYTDERCFITELINRPDVSAFSLAQARVLPGVTTARHALNVDEVYYILNGEGLLRLGSGEGSAMRRGDYVLIPADTPQQITNTGTTDLVFLCICTPRFEVAGYCDLEA